MSDSEWVGAVVCSFIGLIIAIVIAVSVVTAIRSSEARFIAAVESGLVQCTVVGDNGKHWVRDCGTR